jgi:hypothetical protein
MVKKTVKYIYNPVGMAFYYRKFILNQRDYNAIPTGFSAVFVLCSTIMSSLRDFLT